MVYDKHIFICINERELENRKKSCGKYGNDIRLVFKEQLKKNNLKIKIRVNKSGCLSLCSIGPIVVIYPDGIWYTRVSHLDVPEIINTSIVGDGIIERLVYKKNKILSDK